jgi:perosamine synthetase
MIMSDNIPLFEIAWDKQDIINAVDSIVRGSYWAKGPYVDQFEEEIESYLGVEHAVTVNSGTTALVAALEAAGIGGGDEVIVPSMTFIATANAVRLVGAEPVFADVERNTYGLDPEDVRDKLTEKTAAMIPVHLYGGSCQIAELSTIAAEEDLYVVEDAAEAFGAESGGKKVGTFGDAAILSFCQNKIVVTGEGGAIVTDDDELAANLRLYRSHGRVSDNYFDSATSGEYISLGTNIRMSDLTAAVGCAQIGKVDQLIGGRRAAADMMNERLKGVEGISPPIPAREIHHVYQLYTIELAKGIDRGSLIDSLSDEGISSKVYWDTPVNLTQYYSEEYSSIDLPKTRDLSNRLLSLPMYPDLTPEKVERITDAVADGVSNAW